jgi:lipopolysaccharide/colanic/teichoic acid biosynthesis glycosyltransferase
MFVLGILIRLDSPGPAIFRQQRIGYGGKPFSMLKFRTMHDRRRASGGDALRESMTLDGDARITRIGRFLRRSRIDELPQLVNVLLGQMSLIGPRPEAVPLSGWYSREVPFYLYRHIVRPGITGWAQVNQGHVAELSDVNLKLHYDFFYIKNFSFWLDLLITMKTVRIVLTGFGAK